jgi:hypothetical protein
MDHFIDFDPYTIGQHSRQMRTETDSLRLQEQLRKNRKLRRSSRLFAWVKRMARSGDPFSRDTDSEPQAQMASSKQA